MATMTVPTITATQAQAEAKEFLSKRVAYHLVADSPQLDAEAGVWRVPVLLHHLFAGPIGQAGEILVSATSNQIVSHTPVEELIKAVHRLTKQYRKATEASVTDGAGSATTPGTASMITALEAQAEANLFLSDHLPDRFMAGDPSLDEEAGIWRAPVLLAYAIIGPVGQTGEILVSAASGEVVSYTPLDEMKAAARALYARHREAIEAPVP
jgi:hypothetical protein